MSGLVWAAVGFLFGLLVAWRVLRSRSRRRQERLGAEISDRDRRIAALQARVASLDASLLSAIAEPPQSVVEVEHRRAVPTANVAEPIAEPATVLSTELSTSLTPEQPAEPIADDLTRIRGVGPKLAELLASEGVTRFAQIAAFDASDLTALDAKLGAFKGRAVRDDWVGQAAVLAAAKPA